MRRVPRRTCRAPTRTEAMAAALLLLTVPGSSACSLFGGDSERVPTSYCWGAVEAAEVDGLLPDSAAGTAASGRPRAYQDRSEPLAYPTAYETYCQVTEPGAVLPVFEYAIRSTYQELQWPAGLAGADAGLVTTLGEGIVGTSSETGAWIGVPPCRSGDGVRYAQLTIRPPLREAPADPSRPVADAPHRRPDLAGTLVAMTNTLRTQAGCDGDRIPAPTAPTLPAPARANTSALCGTALPTAPAPLRYTPGPAWTESWSGFDDRHEDCLVRDEIARPVLRVQTYRGELAGLEISVIQQGDVAGTMHTTDFPGTQSTYYWGVCTHGPVYYRVETTAAAVSVPTAESLLTALIAANTPRDGCGPPRSDRTQAPTP